MPRLVVLILGLVVPPWSVSAAERPVPSGQTTAAPSPAGAGLGLAEAVDLMTRHDPLLELGESAVTAARGDLQVERGLFDLELLSSLDRDRGEVPVDALTSRRLDSLASSLALSKLFRSGFEVTPGVSLDRTGSGSAAANSGTVSLGLRKALLEGRRRSVVTARERAARHRLDAQRQELDFLRAERTLAVTRSYWLYAAAALDLQVLEASEASSRTLLDTTRELIAADVTPAAEIVQLEADLLAKQTAVVGGRQNLVEARFRLGLEIGLPVQAIATLPLPSDPLPTHPSTGTDTGTGEGPEPLLAALVDRALAQRADLAALEELRAAADAFEEEARDALQPELDLLFVPRYSSIVSGDDPDRLFAPLYQDIPGAAATLGFDFRWAPANTAAEGALLRAQAQRDQATLAIERTVREVGAEVAIAHDALDRSRRRLELSTAAIRLFERAVENEGKKLRAGQSTLIDLIIQRDRLTGAQRQEVGARLDLALAVAELAFQTGTLVSDVAPDPASTPVVAVDRFEETDP
jgi:outer membrane protein TolC